MPDSQERAKPKHLFPESLQITPAILVELAPRLAPYMPARTSDKNWPAIIDAAQYLSGEMGVNRTLWGRACEVMGREYAAVAIAVVSTHPAEHFTKSAGSYFGGMVKKFEKNPQDLCLSRTLWRLKEQAWGTEGHKERRDLEKARRRSSTSEPVMTTARRVIPARTVLPSPAAIPSVTPATGAAQQVPTGGATASATASKYWRPPAGLLEEARQVGLRIRLHQHDEQTKATLTHPDNDTAPPDEDKE